MAGTSADGFITTVVGLEVCGEFFELGLASLGGHDALVGEDDCLGPLHRCGVTSVIFSSSSVSFLGSRLCSASMRITYIL